MSVGQRSRGSAAMRRADTPTFKASAHVRQHLVQLRRQIVQAWCAAPGTAVFFWVEFIDM